MKDRVKMITILTNARRLIEDHEWTKLAAARDEEGNPVTADSRKAHSFCLLGAIQRVTNDMSDQLAYQDEANTVSEIHNILATEYDQATRGVPSIAFFNDSVAKTEDDIFELIDRTTTRLIKELD